MIEHARRKTIYNTDLVVIETGQKRGNVHEMPFLYIIELWQGSELDLLDTENVVQVIERHQIKNASQRKKLIAEAIKSDFYLCDF